MNRTPTFKYEPTSPKSVTFVGLTQRSVVFDISVAFPPGNVRLAGSGDCVFECDTFEVYNVGQFNASGGILANAPKLVNCSYGFYLLHILMALSKSRIPGFVIILFQNGRNRIDADLGNSTGIAGVKQRS
jgi:hypothetical protein